MLDQFLTDACTAWFSDTMLVLAGLIPGLLVYGTLADQIFFEGRGQLRALRFGRTDIVIATLLTAFFLSGVILTGFSAAKRGAQMPAMPEPALMVKLTVVNAVFFGVIIAGILISLSARQIRWRECFGLTKLGFPAIVSGGVLLILAALPLIIATVALARVLLAAEGYVDDSPQELVVFLKEGPSHAARWTVAMFAVVAAPIEEEFLFRGYLYGVIRRYAGPPVGILLNAALFAAIHQHLPSFGGLFVLAVCLTLAYEWTGSLFVPMVMHAIFNSFTVVQLLSSG